MITAAGTAFIGIKKYADHAPVFFSWNRGQKLKYIWKLSNYLLTQPANVQNIKKQILSFYEINSL